jgi:hypothetical protein
VNVSVHDEYLRDMTARFRDYKTLADKSIAQVSDEELFRTVDPESNSLAIILRHMAGNMRSRWRDFLTTDGEKSDRNRDGEFALPPGVTRAAVLADWESGWACLFEELARVRSEDLAGTVRVRSEPLSVISAINRQLGHAAYHAGQIVLLAKHFRSGAWQSLSVPRGASDAFNQEMRQKFEVRSSKL